MKCSEARGLFSEKADEELSGDRLSILDGHLTRCRSCRQAWMRYRSTIELLHRLPEETTDPAFVGQVLDRVRAYEAEGERAMEPMDHVRRPRLPVFEWVRRWLDPVVLRPVPAFALGALVVGIAVGSWANRFTAQGPEGPVGTSVAEATAPAASAPAAVGTNTRLQPVVDHRPFEDLADEIRAREIEPQTARVREYSPNWGATGLQQQVRFENDGPRIIF